MLAQLPARVSTSNAPKRTIAGNGWVSSTGRPLPQQCGIGCRGLAIEPLSRLLPTTWTDTRQRDTKHSVVIDAGSETGASFGELGSW